MEIIKSELNDGRLAALISSLNDDAADAAKLISALDGLVAKLQTEDANAGEIFNKVSSKIETYKGILQTRKEAAEKLANEISNGVNSMLAFMEEFDSIDEEDAESIRTKITQLESDIQNARATVGDLYKKLKYYSDEVSENGIKQARINIQNFYNKIDQWEAEKEVAKKMFEKIEQLSSVDSQASSFVSSLQGTISSYKSKTDGVKQSNLPDNIVAV